jgi:hypothetical protein
MSKPTRKLSWYQSDEVNVISMENVVKIGNLEKRGHFRTNWQMRKFTLDDKNIKYFDETDKMKGSLDLLGAKLVDVGGSNNFDFDIITSVPAVISSKEKSYTLNLRAASFKEKEEWIDMIKKVTSKVEVGITSSYIGYPSALSSCATVEEPSESFNSNTSSDQNQSPKAISTTNNSDYQSPITSSCKEESDSSPSVKILNNLSQNESNIPPVNEELDVQNRLSDDKDLSESNKTHTPSFLKDQSRPTSTILNKEPESTITTLKDEEVEIVPSSTVSTQESAHISITPPQVTSSETVTNTSSPPKSLELEEEIINPDIPSTLPIIETKTIVKSPSKSIKKPAKRSSIVQIINKVNSDSDSEEEFIQDDLYSQIPTNLDEMIVKEGNLQKEGHIYKNWKFRKFVLTGKSIKYYDDKNILKGTIELQGSKVFDCKLDDEDRTKTNIDYDFEILTNPTMKNDKKISKDKNYIRVRAATDFEKQDWIHTIEQVLSSLEEGVKVEKVLTQDEKRILIENFEKEKIDKEKVNEKKVESVPILERIKKGEAINTIKDSINKEIEENKSNFFDVITTLTKDVAPKTWMTVIFTLFALLVMNKWLSLLSTFIILYLVQTGKI